MSTNDSLPGLDVSTNDLDTPSISSDDQHALSEQAVFVKPIQNKNLLEQRILWNTYFLMVVLTNVICLFFKGYPADLGYWADWVKQLLANGYQNFSGNYPPIYVHWLWLVSKFYLLTGQPVEANVLLKFLTQIPVLAAHLALTRLVFNSLIDSDTSRLRIHFALGLTAINPALIINGPIWGQVDLIPIYFACLAILAGCSSSKSLWMVPLFVLSLLTKFQMIALAPVFGFLFFRDIKKQCVGILIGIAIITLAFLPYVIAGNFIRAVNQAYIDTLGQYPVTTFNAANIWILLTGNNSTDSRILFGDFEGFLKSVFMAKHFGILCFALLSLVIFSVGVKKQWRLVKNLCDPLDSGAAQTYYLNKHLELALFAATLCALGFFFFLPAMHERYLFPAVVLSLLYFTHSQKSALLPLCIALTSAFNMLIIVELNGSDIWRGLSWSVAFILAFCFIDFLFDSHASKLLMKISEPLLTKKYFPHFLLVTAILLLTIQLSNHFRIHSLSLAKNQIVLTDLPKNYAHQDHGSMAYNRSFDGNRLAVGNQRFATGIGTHANSDIQFVLPKNALWFSFIPGLDDEVGTADVVFSVWGDNKLLWKSPRYYGNESAKTIKLNVEQVELLNLRVDSLGDDRWDHADWINPVIELKE